MLNMFLRSWFKGADTTSLCLYLESKYLTLIADNPEHEHKGYFCNILETLKAANVFLKTLYHASVWLTSQERSLALTSSDRFFQAFAACANYAYSIGKARWKYIPKFHMFAEIAWRLRKDQSSSLYSLNPVCEATQVDEDFVGRVSTMSRAVSIRTQHFKTLERYRLGLAARW